MPWKALQAQQSLEVEKSAKHKLKLISHLLVNTVRKAQQSLEVEKGTDHKLKLSHYW